MLTHQTKAAIAQVAKRASTWAVGRGASPYAFVRSPRGFAKTVSFALSEIYKDWMRPWLFQGLRLDLPTEVRCQTASARLTAKEVNHIVVFYQFMVFSKCFPHVRSFHNLSSLT